MSQKSKAQLQQEVVELKAENQALKTTVDNLLKEIERLKDIGLVEIDPNIPVEEQILLKQINFFVAESMTRVLSLDETRALDLLLKNKRILDDKKPPEEEEVPELTDADLLRIVNDEEQEAKKVRKRSKSKASN